MKLKKKSTGWIIQNAKQKNDYYLVEDVEKLQQLNKEILEFMNEGCCACDNCCKEAREKIYKWTEAMKL